MSAPSVADVAFEQAQKAYQSGDWQTALILANESINHDPKFFKPWVLRGAVHLINKNFYPAVLNNDKALELEPTLFQALNNRAAGYMGLNLLDEAVADLNKAIEINADSLEPHLLLGLLYASIDQFDAAEYHFRESVRLNRNHFVPHLALGTLLLGLGQWKEGFAEDMHRLEMTQQKFEALHWQGEDLNDKKLLLFSESGQGDRILSFRYINLVRELYPNVKITVKVMRSMLRLVRQSFPDIDVITESMGEGFDHVCSLLNVPMVLDLNWKTVPRPEKYLRANQGLIDSWKPRLAKLSPYPKIGLCWISTVGVAKILSDAAIEELGSTPNVNFISLQVPPKTTKAKIELNDWTNTITDWADTAALIENLDLVITVDTAVAHMAGALGKPVWVLVRYSTYWPWLAARLTPTPRYSIWYPSMQLFRQQIAGDWMMPMSRIVLELQRHLVR